MQVHRKHAQNYGFRRAALQALATNSISWPQSSCEPNLDNNSVLSTFTGKYVLHAAHVALITSGTDNSNGNRNSSNSDEGRRIEPDSMPKKKFSLEKTEGAWQGTMA